MDAILPLVKNMVGNMLRFFYLKDLALLTSALIDDILIDLPFFTRQDKRYCTLNFLIRFRISHRESVSDTFRNVARFRVQTTVSRVPRAL